MIIRIRAFCGGKRAGGGWSLIIGIELRIFTFGVRVEGLGNSRLVMMWVVDGSSVLCMVPITRATKDGAHGMVWERGGFHMGIYQPTYACAYT